MVSQEAKKIQEAMRLRGFRLRTSLYTYRYIGYYLGAIFIKSYDSGTQVQRAMELRGFNGTFWLIDHFTLKKADMVFFAVGIGTIGLIFFGDHFGNL